MSEWEHIVEIVRRLRDPVSGCPWDCRQTLMSLRRFLVEESGEYLEAVESGDDAAVCEELGDLLLQVVLNAQVAADEGKFTLEDVAAGICVKMIRRHPHVFGGSPAQPADDAALTASWERAKRAEKGHGGASAVPRNLPGLMRAQKVLRRLQAFPADAASAAEDVRRRLAAFEAAPEDVKAREYGALIESVAALGSSAGLQAEDALQDTVTRRLRLQNHPNDPTGEK